jgi:hypothetical protein
VRKTGCRLTPKLCCRATDAYRAGIDSGYHHYAKTVTTREALRLPSVALKWYDIHRPDQLVPAALALAARQRIENDEREGRLEARGLGFVLLHWCGESFYFLIVCTWNHSNELWETVYYKDGDAMLDFAPFPREGVHKPAFCVWELAPVWHEQQAWVRFLGSARDGAATAAYLRDHVTGMV